MRRAGAYIIAAVALAGCVSAPQPQKTVVAGPDESIVVVRRINNFSGAAVNAAILVDGIQVEKIATGNTVRFTVPNGSHTIFVGFYIGRSLETRSNDIRFTAQSEEVSFIATVFFNTVALKLDSTRPLESAPVGVPTGTPDEAEAAPEDGEYTPGAAREQSGRDKPLPPQFFFSVAVQPKPNWIFGSGSEIPLDYKPNAGSFFTYEASLRFRWGLNLLVSANIDDTIIGKASALAGFLGYKNFALRVSTSRITGDARWHDSGDDRFFEIDTSYLSAELLYQIFPRIGAYAGLSYIDYTLPVELDTYGNYYSTSAYQDENGEYHVSRDYFPKEFYDENCNVKLYGLSLVVDSFNTRLFLSKQDEKDPGITSYPYFRPWGVLVNTIGLAQITVSPKGIRGFKAMNPAFTVKSEDAITTFGNYMELTAGLMSVFSLPGKARLGLGVGYTLAFLGILLIPSSPPDGELAIHPQVNLFRQGLLIKCAVSW